MESVCARHLAGAGFALLLTVGSAGAAGNDADALISGEQVVNERDASSRAGAPEDAGNAETPETYPSIKLPDPPETRARPARGPVLDEIIVTAQKRPQTLADVPISVTAISGEKLRDAGIENLSDLSEYAPNFKLVEGGLVPLIYMRGVGSGSNQGFEMSVGMYSDGIHLGRPHQTLQAFLDAERVEVLKGPQCCCRPKTDHLCRLKIDQGWKPGAVAPGVF